MDQEKFGKFIKDIRKKHHLTQKQFADKYHVTYQAVSKWENGLNMPDTSLIKQISKDFGISLDELLDGEYKEAKKKKTYLIAILIILLFVLCVISIVFFLSFQKNDFHFKTLSTQCDNFNISGSISYNENKSAIYITNIKYCGGDEKEEYKTIECVLYESNNNVETKISSVRSTTEKIKLEDFLQSVTFSVDHYEKACKEYKEDSFYLLINATDYNSRIITYKVPLKLDSCNVKK